jgi:Thiamine pyrophosphate enzyme, C-terminal TPP binding domain
LHVSIEPAVTRVVGCGGVHPRGRPTNGQEGRVRVDRAQSRRGKTGEDERDGTCVIARSAVDAGRPACRPSPICRHRTSRVCPAANLPVKGRNAFLCSGVRASIGHSVAAAVGASFGSSRRPLVICGDGGFHMTAQALSTMAYHGRNPVVVDNGIYGYEQYLVDKAYFGNRGARPKPYVTLNRWDFVEVANGLGVRSARSVDTAAAFDQALAAATASNSPALIVATINPHDLPAGLS